MSDPFENWDYDGDEEEFDIPSQEEQKHEELLPEEREERELSEEEEEQRIENKVKRQSNQVVVDEFLLAVTVKKAQKTEQEIEEEDKPISYLSEGKGLLKGEKLGFKSIDNSILYINDIVQVPNPKKKNKFTVGIISFIGETHFEKDTLIGISLFEEGIGQHDGEVDGTRYFQCREKCGIFVKPTDCKRYKPNLDNIPEMVKVGYLVKQGSRVKSWKKRWFILSFDFLHYFETPFSKTELGRLHLIGYKSVEIADKDTGKNYTFKILGKKRTFYAQANSEESRNEWMKSIENALKVANARGEIKDKQAQILKEIHENNKLK